MKKEHKAVTVLIIIVILLAVILTTIHFTKSSVVSNEPQKVTAESNTVETPVVAE